MPGKQVGADQENDRGSDERGGEPRAELLGGKVSE